MIGNYESMLEKLTLEEKASLCSGLDFWHTKPIERLGIPSIMVADGPHGLRKQVEQSEQVSVTDCLPATCFPTGSCLASSWDTDLLSTVGIALGEECKAAQVSVLLGPAVNIKRSPLCGRNFEYYSEDPYLSSALATSYINGLQSNGVGACIKHFAANNQEFHRFTVDARITERALREIYLASFERSVTQSKPWTVMSAYNKVNGIYASEHPLLLNEILREEWGFSGLVMTDWGANHDRVAGIEVGEDLEMPGNEGLNDQKIVQAVQKGLLNEKDLDRVVTRILRLVDRACENLDENVTYDQEAHHQLAKDVASKCMVLLKNQEATLPLDPTKQVLVVGPFAKKPRFQGGGSSHIIPTKVSDVFSSMQHLGSVSYMQGFSIESEICDKALEQEVLERSKQSETVVVFAGLPDEWESEAYDREHLRLPENQNELIRKLAAEHPKIVVVLSNGAPVELPWIHEAKGVLEAYLAGQASGAAVADILYGIVNPSGKLAETFPLRVEDTPSYLEPQRSGDTVVYAEDVFVGYRYYTSRKMPVLFPFGFGLSYTKFSIELLTCSHSICTELDEVTVQIRVKNYGNCEGREVVQVYVTPPKGKVSIPCLQLRGFQKVSLKPGTSKIVTFMLNKKDFSYFDDGLKQWVVEGGDYCINIGNSSDNLCVSHTICMRKSSENFLTFTMDSMVSELLSHSKGNALLKPAFDLLPFDLSGESGKMMWEIVKAMPVRHLVTWSNGKFSESMAEELLKTLNTRV
ncbi:glycoside hydrolase family 3 C-terminal domain-containing protein [uncultured Sphaerochaeta sp.]|uniref:glycoside hydrolase family 3 C-terminal domain-containing protein n=1 Tax=uncultured Sphaerochaeta sp. TaxID=886478 RepID=UPI002AA6143D|nr:glycoside hydrolase family 3 C-terminal domain-containing protein [uncultured Sphaerochaeta sp.]